MSKEPRERLRNDKGQFVAMAEAGPGSPPSGETATISSALGGLGITSYNPDLLVQSKGGLDVYRKMVADPHVKAALQQKKSALLAVPWDIVPSGNTDADLDIADFVRWNLTEFLVDSFSTDLMEFLYALDDGFSISEKVWKVVDEGPWKGKWAYSQFKSKDPKNYKFKLDNYGNILPDGLVNEDAKSSAGKDLSIEKFFLFSYQKRYENPYGQSDLRAAYRAFWIKDVAWKLRSIYMERYSGNFLKGKYKPGDTKGQAKLLEIFRSWSQETGVALPDGIDIEVIQLATSSGSEFDKAITAAAKEIIIGILGASLTVDEGQKTGARALGDVHMEVAKLFILSLDITLTSEINKQIIRPLVDFNFPGVVNYPKFAFDARSEITANDIKTLKDAGIPIPDEWVYRKLKIPAPTDEEAPTTQLFKYHIDAGAISRNEIRERLGLEPLKGDYFEQPIDPASLSPQGEQAFSDIMAMARSGVLKFQDQVRISPALLATGVITLNEAAAVDPKSFSSSRPVPRVTSLQEPPEPVQAAPPPDGTDRYYRPLNEFERFAEIPRVDNKLRLIEETSVNASRPAYEDIKEQVFTTVEKQDMLTGDPDQAKVDATRLTVNVGKLRDVLFKTTLTSDLDGRADQVTEMVNQGMDLGKFMEYTQGVWRFQDELLTPKEALKAFASRVPLTKDAFDALVESKKASAFSIAGLEKKNIEKDVQPLIIEAINTGMDLSQFQFRLDQLFIKYINPAYGQVGAQGETILDYHTETVFRNAIMQSYNTGKEDLRADTELLEAFPASIYSAIMDQDTSKICRDLDTKVFLVDDPQWQPYKPQNHHRCRSTTIAINKFDFNPDMLSGAPPSSVVLPAGFGGG